MLVLCMVLNGGLAENHERGEVDLLSEMREAFNEGEGKGKAVLMTRVLGISMEELNNRLIFEALNKGFAFEFALFMSQFSEEEYVEISQIVGEEEYFNNLRNERINFFRPIKCIIDKVKNLSVSYFNCIEETFGPCYKRRIHEKFGKGPREMMAALTPSPQCVSSANCTDKCNNLTSNLYYTHYITNQTWKRSLEECQSSDQTSLFSITPCSGFLPLQFVMNRDRCRADTHSCIDRTDKVLCKGNKFKKSDMDTLLFPPVVKAVEREILPCPTLEEYVEISQIMGEEEIAGDQEKSVFIDGACIPITDLCQNSKSLNEEWYYHPQHIAICRDWHFWNARKSSHCDNSEPCNGNYPGLCKGYCIDRSEETVSQQDREGFCCIDKKKCIWEWLVCDGYTQCDDGSDEEPQLCSVCPKEIGWPYRPIEKRLRATLPCKHRYHTNRTICSTPCDGIDDMCANYEDEDNCKIPGFLDLVFHVAVASILSGIIAFGSLALGGRLAWLRNDYLCSTECSNYLDDASVADEAQKYIHVRESGRQGEAVQNFALVLGNCFDIMKQRDLTLKLLRAERALHQDENALDIFILKTWGTNDSIGRLYDLLDKSMSVKIETFLYKKLPLPVYNMMGNIFIRMSKVVISNFVKLTLYYTDVYKDVRLAVLIFTQVIVQVKTFENSSLLYEDFVKTWHSGGVSQ